MVMKSILLKILPYLAIALISGAGAWITRGNNIDCPQCPPCPSLECPPAFSLAGELLNTGDKSKVKIRNYSPRIMTSGDIIVINGADTSYRPRPQQKTRGLGDGPDSLMIIGGAIVYPE